MRGRPHGQAEQRRTGSSARPGILICAYLTLATVPAFHAAAGHSFGTPKNRAVAAGKATTAQVPRVLRAEDAVDSARRRVARPNPRVPFRMRVSTWSPVASSEHASGGVWVVGELDGQTRKELEWNLGGHGELTLLASDGSAISAGAFELVAGETVFGVRMPDTGNLIPGDYSVRVRLRAIAEDGRVLADAITFSVLSRHSPLGEAVLWRRGPSTGLQHVRTADVRFQRNERLRLELPTTSTAPAVARVLDRLGKPLQVPPTVTTRTDASGEFQWVVVDAPMAPFAPGEYALEVIQEDGSQTTAFSVIP